MQEAPSSHRRITEAGGNGKQQSLRQGDLVRQGSIRVAVRAPYPAVRAGLAAMLREDAFDLIEDLDAVEALDLAAPDVLVIDLGSEDDELDLDMPAVYLAEPGAAFDSESSVPRAWLPRDATSEELGAAVRAVAAGMIVLHPSFAETFARAPRATATPSEDIDMHVTVREREVLRLVALGYTNKAIAHSLGISEHTAKFHVGTLLSKLGAHSRTEAVTAAARRGVLTL
jgi:DNA-binding NarL/FixJ family response regulator